MATLLRVTVEAKEAIKSEARARGMDQKEVASRLIMWFAGESRDIRSLILGHDISPSARAALIASITK